MTEKKQTGWKVTAVIFIILFISMCALVVFIFTLGFEIIDIIVDENECIVNICADYETYYFDSTSNICSCYTDNELIYQEIIK